MTTLQPPAAPAHAAALLPDASVYLVKFPPAPPATRALDLSHLKRRLPAAGASKDAGQASSTPLQSQHHADTEQHRYTKGQGRSSGAQQDSALRDTGDAHIDSVSHQDVLELTAALREHAAAVTDSTDALKAVLQQLRASQQGVVSGGL